MMKPKLPLFSAYGVELEYMIVNKDNLSVFPISDQLIHEVVGAYQNEVAFEHIAWSNELVLHVIELKTNGPAKTLQPLSSYFQHEIQKINELLEKHDAKLLPTGAHPWMDPYSESKLWPHDYNIIYETYDRIFNCKGHGWSNLQSVHLNLPFANDEEFAKLHTAIRLVLPIIPAISASTPIIDRQLTGLLDTRLEFYRLNQQKYPRVTGLVIPELVFSRQEYQDKILKPMYEEIAAADPQNVLQEEWLNSRGAIAVFDRNTIEIRVVDIQECPLADLAILDAIVTVLQALVEEKWSSFSEQIKWSEDRLHKILLDTMKFGSEAMILDESFPTLFGLPASKMAAKDLWQYLLEDLSPKFQDPSNTSKVLSLILRDGNLAERIVKSLKGNICEKNIGEVYQKLASCLQQGKLFLPC